MMVRRFVSLLAVTGYTLHLLAQVKASLGPGNEVVERDGLARGDGAQPDRGAPVTTLSLRDGGVGRAATRYRLGRQRHVHRDDREILPAKELLGG
jgi:hypothetical protein